MKELLYFRPLISLENFLEHSFALAVSDVPTEIQSNGLRSALFFARVREGGIWSEEAFVGPEHIYFPLG